MEILTFIADWVLNIIGALLILAFCAFALMLLVMKIAALFTSEEVPRQGLIAQLEDSVSGGLSGCFSVGLLFVLGMLTCGFGLWLIDLL